VKIKNKLFIFYFLIFVLLSCNSQNKEISSYEGYPLEVTEDYKNVWVEEFSNNMGTYYFYELKEPKVIQSYPCEGRIRVNPEGIIYGFTLSEDHVINGTLIPKGSWYHRYEDSSYMIHLTKDITIQGYPVYHKETAFFKENNVLFHIDGTILEFYLANNMLIDGIPCNGGKKNSFISLYYSTDLRSCNLSENIEINGIPCQGGEENSELWLHPDGQVILCFLSRDFKIDGKFYAKDTKMIFDKEGKVHFLSGHTDFTVFYENGRVLNCVLDNDIEIEGKLIVEKSRILFYKNGSIWQLKPNKDMVIDGIPCRNKHFIEFYPDGKIKYCNLSKDFEMNGISYKKGDRLNFDEEGKVH